MSRLQELIQRLCPDGVEWVLLDNAIISLNTGLNPRQFFKLNTEDATNYYVTIRELHNNSIVFSDKTDRINDTALKLCNNRSNLEIGDVLFSGTGTIGETAIITAPPTNWNIKEGVYAIKPNATVIEPKFLMYLLKTKYIRKQFLSKAVGGTVKSVPMGELKKIRVPLPPLEVQQEIVRILDRFTQLIAELTEKLDEELAARKQQYEYYADQLFMSDIPFENWMTVEETIFSLKTGLNPRQNFKLNEGGQNPYITGKDIYNNSINVTDKTDFITEEVVALINKRACLETNDVLFASTGTGTVGRMAVVDCYDNLWAVSETIFCLKPKPNAINPYYLMYALYTRSAKNQFEPKISKGSVPHLKVKDLLGVKIPVPNLIVQKKVIDLMHRFDIVYNDLTSGLPAEIAARQKQYEYYRDKLLTFKEKA